MDIEAAELSNNKYKIVFNAFVTLIVCSCSTAYAQKVQPIEMQPITPAENTIVGTWVSHPDGNSKWIFTESRTKIYYKEDLKNEFTYDISRSSIHCGFDVSKRLQEHSNESILTLTDTQTHKERCYYISYDDKNLNLNYFGNSHFLLFKKQ